MAAAPSPWARLAMSLFGRIAGAAPMNGYNFTERTRRVLGIAREEAVRLRHEYVGTEHILLGILADDGGVASAVLRDCRVDPAEVRRRLDEVLTPGTAHHVRPDVPYTSRAKKVLELAMTEAREMNHGYVGTEHLLLGLIREAKGIAAQALVDAGLTLDAARDETMRLLGPELSHDARDARPPAPPPPPPPPPPPGSHVRPPALDVVREEAAWRRLQYALDVTTRLGATPTLRLEDDGTLTVSVGPDLVVSVDFPPDVRLRHRGDAPPNAPPNAL